MPRSILILGGTGFLGRPLAQRLSAHGDRVVTLSRSPLADVQIDARDLAALGAYLASHPFDVVINLLGAGLATASVDERTLAAVNSAVPAVLMEALLRHQPATQVLHAASSTERSSDEERDESEYSRTKHEGAEALRALAERAQEPVTLLRIHNTYGPGQPASRFIAGTIAALAADQPLELNYPERIRDFVFVDDVVESFVQAVEVPRPGLTEAELGTGVGTSLLDAATAVARAVGRPTALVTGVEPPLIDPHPYAVAATPGGSMGTCLTSLEDGLARTMGER